MTGTTTTDLASSPDPVMSLTSGPHAAKCAAQGEMTSPRSASELQQQDLSRGLCAARKKHLHGSATA